MVGLLSSSSSANSDPAGLCARPAMVGGSGDDGPLPLANGAVSSTEGTIEGSASLLSAKGVRGTAAGDVVSPSSSLNRRVAAVEGAVGAAGADSSSSSPNRGGGVPVALPTVGVLMLGSPVPTGAAVEGTAGAAGEDGSSSSPNSDAPAPADFPAP